MRCMIALGSAHASFGSRCQARAETVCALSAALCSHRDHRQQRARFEPRLLEPRRSTTARFPSSREPRPVCPVLATPAIPSIPRLLQVTPAPVACPQAGHGTCASRTRCSPRYRGAGRLVSGLAIAEQRGPRSRPRSGLASGFGRFLCAGVRSLAVAWLPARPLMCRLERRLGEWVSRPRFRTPASRQAGASTFPLLGARRGGAGPWPGAGSD